MSEIVWQAVIDGIPTLEAWNANLAALRRLVDVYGKDCAQFILAEAKRREYEWNPDAREYRFRVPVRGVGGKNVIGVGWKEGRLVIIFAAKEGSRRYESSEPNVPEDVYAKLSRSPYPDKLYTQIVKDKYPMRRIDAQAATTAASTSHR